jgi:hypothetical protein
MKIDKIESVMVEISNKELEEIILQYVNSKHTDFNSNKWELEDFDISWGVNKEDGDRAVSLFYTRSQPFEENTRNNKCAGNCGACSNSVCR